MKHALALALRLPGEAIRYFQDDEKGELQFHWVDFWQEKPQRFPVSARTGMPALFAPVAQPEQKELSAAQYQAKVAQAIALLREKDWGKIVMSRSAYRAGRVDSHSLFAQLCSKYPEALVYLFSHAQLGTWLGASPEILLSCEADRLYTMSLAGTRRAQEKTAFAAKEEHEQAMVTEFIFAQLRGQKGLSELRAGERREHQAGALRHLLTPIEAQISQEFDISACLSALHPTPAVAGFPRREALDFLRAEEGYERSFYSGYLGLETKKHSQFWVNLRCAQVLPRGLQVYAGGGITLESDPQAEWEETEAKMRTILDPLTLIGSDA